MTRPAGARADDPRGQIGVIPRGQAEIRSAGRHGGHRSRPISTPSRAGSARRSAPRRCRSRRDRRRRSCRPGTGSSTWHLRPAPSRSRRSYRFPGRAATRASRRRTRWHRRRSIACVPLPWWASQSITRTESPRSRRYAAVTATLLTKQNPIAAIQRVVPGRTHRTERRVAVTAFERRNRFEPGTGGMDRRVPGARRSGSIGIERATPGRADPLDLVEVGRGVHTFELGARRGAWFEMTNCNVGAGIVETGQHGLHPLGPLRMPAPRIVLGETRIRSHQQHAVRLPRAPVSGRARARPMSTVTSGEDAVVPLPRRVARVAAWHGRPDIASVALQSRSAISIDAVERLLDQLRAAGYCEVITNAARARFEPAVGRFRLRRSGADCTC